MLSRPIPGAVLLLVLGTATANSSQPDQNHLVRDRQLPLVDATTVWVTLGFGAAALWSAEIEDISSTDRMIDGSPLEGAVEVADWYGDGAVLGSVSLGLMAVGEIGNHSGASRLGRDLATSLLATWSVVWMLKLTVDSPRPDGGAYSFPSGHAATAFAAAPVLTYHLGTKAGVVSVLLATLTGLARMEEQKHYPVDVLAGAGIGVVIGRAVARRSSSRYSVLSSSRGLGLSMKF